MSQEWYYAVGGVQNGPVGIDDLRARHVAGQIPADALIWREGMDNWKTWHEVPELAGGSAVAQPSVAVGGGNVYASPAAPQMAGAAGMGMQAKPPSYLWQSIVCTLLCCLPFGVVGIVYAAKVESLASAGNAAAAIEASNKAKFWCWMSFGFSLGFFVIYLILMAVGVAVN